MTYIQPNQAKDILNRILFLLISAVAIAAVLLIIMYSRTVSVDYKIGKLKSEIKETQADSAELQNQIFNVANSDNLEWLASERGLVKEKNPQYLQLRNQWAFVSAR